MVANRRWKFVVTCFAVFGLASSHLGVFGDPPTSKKQRVTDEFHGTVVQEDYRWLEDWENEQVKQWSEAQNKFAREYLDTLPHAKAIRASATEILSAESSSYGSLTHRANRYFAIKSQPPKQQPFIVTMLSVDDPDSARIVVDPNEIDKEGTTAIDWFKVSPDARYVAVSLSSGGSEAGDLTVFDAESGEKVFEKIEYVNSGTAGGSLAWAPDSKGFYYTRHFRIHPDDPNDINVFQQLFFHELGTSPKKDRYELGEGFPQIAEIQLVMNSASGNLLATVQEGDGGQFAHYLRDKSGKWQQFSRFGDGLKQAVFGQHDDLYLVTLKDAPRGKILRMPLNDLDVSKAKTVIPEGEDAIVTSGIAFWGEQTVVPMKTRMYVVYQLGGPSVIRAFDLTGKSVAVPRQLDVSSVHGLLPIGDDDLLFGNASFIDADALYRYTARTNKTRKTAIADSANVDFGDTKVVREFATSKDGTKVPVNIVMPRGTKLDGSNPCIVTGYGGYGINITPRFRPLNRMLMDHGVIYAVANLRGGGEYGEEWHRQGNLTRKQNVFDDFAAVLEHVVERGYTRPKRLGITGGSNGGLLMGATMVQRPELANAVVTRVGIYDMLRVELSANGAFNVTEFGTVKDKAQFDALRAYSPYHNVQDDVSYPATMFVTGANDPRVDPMQSRKMTARLQAVPKTGAPILLRTSANAGHGGDHSLSEAIEQAVDVYSFLFKHISVPAVRVSARAPQRDRIQPTHANVSYGPASRNVLDLYLAKSDSPTPMVVYIHGGGFVGGDKRSVSQAVVKTLNEAKISVAAIHYRFVTETPFPAPQKDAARAIQFMRHNAKKWNLDPKRFAAYGGSAGAGLSLWLGFHDDMADPDSDDPVLRQSTRLMAVGSRGGQTSYDPNVIKEWIGGRAYEHPSIFKCYGIRSIDEITRKDLQPLYDEVSAIKHLTDDDPPVHMVYNEADRPLPENARPGQGIHHPIFAHKLTAEMKKLKIESVYRHVSSFKSDPNLDMAESFIKWLK